MKIRAILTILVRTAATIIAVAFGVIVYDLAVRDGFVMQLGTLLLLLVAQFGAGWLLGVLMHSWRTLLAVPGAFVLGFVVATPLRTAGIGTELGASGTADQLAGLAGGDAVLATVFMLAFLCCILALGTALGTTRGIRIERQMAWRRAQVRALRLRALAESQAAPAASASQRELVPAGH